jgi:hypothetical protein
MRLVLVDRQTDRVCGDTAVFAATSADWAENSFRGVDVEHMALIAARLLDEANGNLGWKYKFACFETGDKVHGYDVFRMVEDDDRIPSASPNSLSIAMLLTHSQFVGHIRRAPPAASLTHRRKIKEAGDKGKGQAAEGQDATAKQRSRRRGERGG